MKMLHALLAQSLLPNDVIPGARHWMGLSLKELLIVLGSVGIVTLILFLWAVYFRRSPRRHSHRHHHHSSADESAAEEGVYLESGSAEGESGRRYRRKRRRRRDHRPRNPTLAETGGLPPLRADHPPDPLP